MATDKSGRFFKTKATPNPHLLWVEGLVLDIADINYIQFDDEMYEISVGFKSNHDHVFSYKLGYEYRKIKHRIMEFLDKL